MFRFAAAPWSTTLKVASCLGTGVLGAVSYALLRTIPRGIRLPFANTIGTLIILIPAVTLVTALFFVVTGYTLDRTELSIQRLLWSTSIPLAGLTRAWHSPSAMARSLRLFGNGGLFSITGLFRNSSLGTYRAFVTDPSKAVVLRLPARVVVLSPADPAAFLAHLRSVLPEAAIGEPRSAA